MAKQLTRYDSPLTGTHFVALQLTYTLASSVELTDPMRELHST